MTTLYRWMKFKDTSASAKSATTKNMNRYSDTSLLWFDLIACPRTLLCRILNSTWPKLVWNCPCLHDTCLHGELVSSPLQTLLSSNTERNPNTDPSRTLDYKALYLTICDFLIDFKKSQSCESTRLWDIANGLATAMLTRFGCLLRICIYICNNNLKFSGFVWAW